MWILYRGGLMFGLVTLLALPVAAKCPAVHRSSAVRRAFQQQQPCPSTGRTSGACPNWVKDHITALACGGQDTVSNMQWMTRAAALAKDKWERKGCPPCFLKGK